MDSVAPFGFLGAMASGAARHQYRGYVVHETDALRCRHWAQCGQRQPNACRLEFVVQHRGIDHLNREQKQESVLEHEFLGVDDGPDQVANRIVTVGGRGQECHA